MTRGLVLYVDDEWSNRVVFEQAFGEKFEIATAENGQEALEILESSPTAVIISDQRMPGMSGMDLLAQVKARFPATVRVAVTAFSDLDPILRAVNEGLVARYVIKPWTHDDLESILSWAIDVYALGSQGSALQMRLIETERFVTLGTLAASLVHDLRQPLSYLRYTIDRLRQLENGAPEELLEELPKLSGDMREGVDLIGGLLSDMNRWMVPHDGAVDRSVLPRTAIDVAMSVCRGFTSDGRIALLYVGPEELPEVKMDSASLTQIFVNLLANANQAIREHESARGVIQVGAEVDGRVVSFSVQDDGPGIAADVLPKVGSLFFTTRPEGTGLGLSQCKRLVGSAGGHFRVESEHGNGTRVLFRVPRV